MSARSLRHPRSQGSIAPRRLAGNLLTALRALVCRLVHCRGQRSLGRAGRASAADGSGTVALEAAALAMQQRGASYSMLLFELRDLPELECVFGARAAQAAMAAFSAQLAKVAGRNGRLVRTGPTLFAVLLPIANPEYALAAAQAVLGRPCRIELQVRGDDVVLLPDVTLQTMAADAEVAPAHEALRRRLPAQSLQPRRTRDRPPLRRPQAARDVAPPAPAPQRQPVAQRAEGFYPATIPVPLGMR